MAHINTSGVHIPLWMTSPMTSIGWGQSPSYPTQEGTFFGQLMVTNLRTTSTPTTATAPGVASDVVPGRIGSNHGRSPYANAYAGWTAAQCYGTGRCTMQARRRRRRLVLANGTTWTTR